MAVGLQYLLYIFDVSNEIGHTGFIIRATGVSLPSYNYVSLMFL